MLVAMIFITAPTITCRLLQSHIGTDKPLQLTNASNTHALQFECLYAPVFSLLPVSVADIYLTMCYSLLILGAMKVCPDMLQGQLCVEVTADRN
jgi:hypothetical protein